MQPYEQRSLAGQAVPPATPAPDPRPATTEGTLLGGRIQYRQFRTGYRTGLEPVLMAALVPARAGERVIEAGCGAGAGLLCLSKRVPGLLGAGIEVDPATAMLARENFSANHCNGLYVFSKNISDPQLGTALTSGTSPFSSPRFDHAFANPPWHRVNTTPSPEERRDKARRANPDTLAQWIRSLASLLRPKGSLTLALPAELTAEALAICEASRIGSAEIVPLWPETGRECRIVLIRARLHGRAGSRILPGLTLHNCGGAFTREAEQILREGCPLFPDTFRSANRRGPVSLSDYTMS